MTQAQQRVQAVLDRLVNEGIERGLQVAVYFQGELVIDAWAGVADATTGQRVDGATLFPVFSTTKGIAATLIHVLAERGQVAYDAPVARYWPEFAANGKAAITVRQALAHTSGIPQMPEGIGHVELGNWERVCAAIAGLKPLWPPGTKMEYHAMTFGWILGEIAQRVTGRSFATLLTEEICRPLGSEDLYVGIPEDLDAPIAWLEDATPMGEPPPQGTPQSVPYWLVPLGLWMNRVEARKACIPASNGIMTARAIARHYAALVPGGVEGVELLPPGRVRAATEMQMLANGEPAGKALGYGLGDEPDSPLGGRRTAFGHGGYGGSLGFADPEYRLAFGLAKNRMTPPPGESAASQVAREVRAALGIPGRQ